MTGIYKYRNTLNNKVYIGQSRDLRARMVAHSNRHLNPKDTSYDTHFYRALRKYGLDSFEYSILEYCSIEELNDRETY